MSATYWLASATANPPREFTQEECFAMAGYDDLAPKRRRALKAIFRAAGVERRALWLGDRDFVPTEDPNDFHRRYVTGIREIAPRAAREALARAGLEAGQIDFLVFVSCTGYVCPPMSIELATELGLREDCPTANLLGMGCSALVPGLERAHDRLRSIGRGRALVVAAEICSATYWLDGELETGVGNALFADGATAVVLTSRPEDLRGAGSRAVARIEGFKTLRDSRHLGEMGFTNVDGRLRVLLSRDIPSHILPLVEAMIPKLELGDEWARVAIHPGGSKILHQLATRAEAGALAHSAAWLKDALSWSKATLAEHGNMSSPTAGFVLERSWKDAPLASEHPGALITMGPGLSVEGMRMRWLVPESFAHSR